MDWKLKVTPRDALRAAVAGLQGSALSSVAHALYEAGGKAVLPAAIQRALRGAIEGEATKLVAGVGLLATGSAVSAKVLEAGAVRAVAQRTATAAGRQILRGVGAAALGGVLVDGGFALVQAVRRFRRGEITKKEAAIYVATEAGAGAAATAAGATAAALVVVITGGVAGPGVFFVGAAASLGARAGLDAWLRSRKKGAIRVQIGAANGAATVAEQGA